MIVNDPYLICTDAPRRVVSLVPSVTESLLELGLAKWVVGCTDFCIRPDAALRLPRIGGPKDARVGDILALQPDLVIVDQEENSPEIVARLDEAGKNIWMVFPHTVRQSLDILWKVAGLFRSEQAGQRVRIIEDSLELAEFTAGDFPAVRYFCPIWQETLDDGVDWWMTFNQDTYASDLLTLVSGVNIFGNRKRRYPLDADLGLIPAEAAGSRDTRYPRVSFEEIVEKDPELILLPSEPFLFDKFHLDQMKTIFSMTTAAKTGRIRLVDGSLLTWYGTRLGAALGELPGWFES